jgi:hypothetical protein
MPETRDRSAIAPAPENVKCKEPSDVQNAVFCDVIPVALVRTDVSDESLTSIILGDRNLSSVLRLLLLTLLLAR